MGLEDALRVTSIELIHHIGLATAPALYKKLAYKTEDLEFLPSLASLAGLLSNRPT